MNFKNWIINKISTIDNYENIINHINNSNISVFKGINGSSKSLLIASLFDKIKKSILYVGKDEKEANNIYLDLLTFGVEKSYYFPSFEITPYQEAIIDQSVISNRLEILDNLINQENCVVCVSLETLLFNIIPKDAFKPFIINLKIDEIIEIDELSKKLIQCGYCKVMKVSAFGDFAVRGDIVDIYYSMYKNPVRIDFFDNKIESIKTFNITTQESENIIEFISIPPHKEFVYGDEQINNAIKKINLLDGDEKEKNHILEKIKNYQTLDGIEFYLPLFYKKSSLLEYFIDPVIIIDDAESIIKAENSLFKEFNESYNYIYNKKKPRFKPEEILFNLNEIYSLSKKVIQLKYFDNANDTINFNLDFKSVPVYLGNLEDFKIDLTKYLKENYKIVLFANNNVQADRLKGILKGFEISDDRFDFSDIGFSVFPLYLTNGFLSDSLKLFFINDHEIFGKINKISKHFYSTRTEVIDSFIDLKPGDYVVHINHGIGKFLGIERVKSFEAEKDYISILYADDDKVFIPVEQLNFIQKYISGEFGNPKLDRIGSKGWTKTKQRVKESIEKLAKELIKLYSYRLNQKGFAFLPDTEWQKEFEAKFPYEETKDQLITLEEVKRDMESSRPMDRLICGDVGFGKTEIAIRASFKAVMSGKQVIILVPTTILAEQHFETFTERLNGYPIKVEMLSRFRSDSEQKNIINKLKDGDIDIIIGTHRLLSEDVYFKNPGLFIIDEEQRFGVKHKEKLKQLRVTIDCLSLTATPIPRTLHMSLSNIRNISIINTPPENRQSVETYVMEFNDEIFIDAVNRELSRNGQIFFLHNRIKTIYTMKKYIEKLIPKSRVVVAHGQLAEEELEDIIHKFIHYEFDILLATTIIESGIDMPRVNTIFINRADKFGLSQLYQLKGRVGRSDKKAYAYLFCDPDMALTEDAMKRLKVISEYTELGSGFKIAMKDLEIRGAGNLLGPEQHGDILAVGFQLYCKLLSEAIRELTPEESENILNEKGEVYLELQYKGYIPDSYISDQKQKMEFYKKIAGAVHIEEIKDIERALIDRFGIIPDEVQSLFYLSEIRIVCREMNITDIIEKNSIIEIKFSKSSKINLNKLMKSISDSKGKIYLNPKKPESIFLKLDELFSLHDKGELLKEILLKIS